MLDWVVSRFLVHLILIVAQHQKIEHHIQLTLAKKTYRNKDLFGHRQGLRFRAQLLFDQPLKVNKKSHLECHQPEKQNRADARDVEEALDEKTGNEEMWEYVTGFGKYTSINESGLLYRIRRRPRN